MIALPSPLGFVFFAFGAFEQLKKISRKPKSLRTMMKEYIVCDSDLPSVAESPGR